ncbi:molecular chaperone HtpG [Insolitispirillum peregrinum]|uniref:Chaperone protein HtpG n=1 Tax=Insolitispirillum peregrinum TaxID=80876 RepID=A0A1N7JRA3_9PROT|nr:molecular chaperone HtpG [Insolitispirillum peregrinum]SIS51766.1 molecular chaperone HtpG [Insolitispirillum peregrinum]
MTEEKLSFQAEVAKLLDIVVHSLYSQKEIFLRELISNASDACDKLRYAALTEPALLAGDADLRIELVIDKDARTLTVRDNGVGMNREDLINNLGTIARSGTSEFVKALSGDQRKDVSLIGQFGVGFYSAYMVAGTVEVRSRKAGDEHGWRWVSDGKGEFTVTEVADVARGTSITLHLKDDEGEFLEPFRLRQVVKTYSDHIALPVVLKGAEGAEDETLNSASALWTRSKSDITDEQYTEFYHHIAHAFDAPWLTLHYRAEGAIEYTGLLFVPTEKPFDLFTPERKNQLKLYVNRVFISGDCEGLLPPYLRFVRGVVDSPDLPLNVSREMLQHNPMLAKIRSGLTKRILSELAKKAEGAADEYATFWATFGAVLKEGLHEDYERRDDITKLCRFASTQGDGLVSLAEYKARMKDGQDAIYFITGESVDALKNSPQVEGYLAKGVEVLLLTDDIDEFWVASVPSYDGTPLKSVGQGVADLSKIKGEEKAEDEAKKDEAPASALDSLIAALKAALGEAVKDVRTTDRLTSSPCCLVANDGEMSLHLERLLKAHKRGPDSFPARVLEINPSHPLIKGLATRAEAGEGSSLDDAAHLLLDQARIIEGEGPLDPVAFARRMAKVMERGFA